MEYGPYSSYLLACAINTLEKISYQVAECVDQSATLRDGLKMMGPRIIQPLLRSTNPYAICSRRTLGEAAHVAIYVRVGSSDFVNNRRRILYLES